MSSVADSTRNFQTSEAYCEDLEDIHASLSKRGALRTALNLKTPGKTPNGNDIKDTTSMSLSSSMHSRSNRASNLNSSRRNSTNSSIGDRREKKSKSERSHRSTDKISEKMSNHSERTRRQSDHSCADTVASGVSTLSRDDSLRDASVKDGSRSGRGTTRSKDREDASVKDASRSGRRTTRSKDKEDRSAKGRSKSRRRSKDKEDASAKGRSKSRRRSKDKEDASVKDASRSGRRTTRSKDKEEDGRRIRTKSEIRKLLDGDFSEDSTKDEDKKESRARSNTGVSRSRSGSGRKSLSGRTTKSIERRVSRSNSDSVPRLKSDTGIERERLRDTIRRSRSQQPSSDKDRPTRSRSQQPSSIKDRPTRSRSQQPSSVKERPTRSRSQQPSSVQDRPTRSRSQQPSSVKERPGRSRSQQPLTDRDRRRGDLCVSLHSIRSYQRRVEPWEEVKTDDDDFEAAWEDRSVTSRGKDRELGLSTEIPKDISTSEHDDSKGNHSARNQSLPTLSSDGAKKTKLEKIRELQAKCDRYKLELKKMAGDREKYRRKTDEYRDEIDSLKAVVKEYEEETTGSQTRIADLQDLLAMTKAEQRTERSELSDAAKELARVNIDYAKSVDEVRILKAEQDRLKETIADREKKITHFEEELRKSQENVKHYEADVLYADDQIHKLESENGSLQIELDAYREAVEQDSASDLNGDGNGNRDNLRKAVKAKEEADKRKFEEREKIIKEKIEALDKQMQEFERKKMTYLEEEKRREQDLEEKRAQEEERLKIADQNRLKEEEEMNIVLQTFEDENNALKGKLKSEQLDSARKLQNKDEAIKQLQQEVARLTIRSIHDSARDNMPALQHDIEALRAEVAQTKMQFEDAHMKNVELQNEVNDLQLASLELKNLTNALETEIIDQKKEVENQKRRKEEWQIKSGEWSDKAFKYKELCEDLEKKVRDSNTDSGSSFDGDTVQIDPQAALLAAAVEKKAVNVSTTNTNSWHLRRLFTQQPASENEDEIHGHVEKLKAENSVKDSEIKKLKSEMVKAQTVFKEKEYSKVLEYERLQKEKEELEHNNAQLLQELELARKLNRTISGALH